MFIHFANSLLPSSLSYSSSVRLTTSWNELNLVKLLIDYIKNRQLYFQRYKVKKTLENTNVDKLVFITNNDKTHFKITKNQKKNLIIIVFI